MRQAAEATTFAELREAGDRFGKVIGPNSVRILLLLAIGWIMGLTRPLFALPFLGEGWPLYWETILYDKGFHDSPEKKVGALSSMLAIAR